MKKIICFGCGKTPNELSEYRQFAAFLGIAADDLVKLEEGTYDDETGYFTCTECYIEMGQPRKDKLMQAYHGREK